jgi:hypothetical protein
LLAASAASDASFSAVPPAAARGAVIASVAFRPIAAKSVEIFPSADCVAARPFVKPLASSVRIAAMRPTTEVAMC